MNSVILRNIGSNWAGMGVNILVAFFMMPFVLGKLGTIGYGFWAFLQSILSFMFILDFGIRSSLTRYLAKYYAENNHPEANRVFNVGLISYSIVSLIIGVGAILLGIALPSFFHLHVSHQTAFFTVVLVGMSVGLNFPASVFNGILTGHQRYDLMNIAQILSLGIRTVLIILWLNLDYGLIAIALATFIGSLSLFFLNFIFARWVYPYMQINFFQWEWGTVKLLAKHGMFSFLAIGSMRLLTDAGVVLVGIFIGPGAVTLYSIAVSLTTYASQLVGGITTTLTPAASVLESKNDWEELVRLCLGSSKLIVLTGFSILIAYVVSGDIFISLWLGEGFQDSYQVLLILSLCWGFHYIQNAVFVILIGLSKHKIPAFFMLAQALLSIGLGVYLVNKHGMLGVAYGALVASVIFNVLSLVYGLSKIKISIQQYLTRALIPAMLGLIPFGLSLTGLIYFYQPSSLFMYFSQIGLSIALTICFLPWLTFNNRELEKTIKLARNIVVTCSLFLPYRFRHYLIEALNSYLFSLVLQRIMSKLPEKILNRADLTELREWWGNESFTVEVEFLEEIAKRASLAQGPILECGSGLSTVVMGIILSGSDVKLWTLEHNPDWHKKIEAVLKKNKILNVEVCLSPLHDYGQFTWYKAPWEKMPSDFQLVICDGPPGTVPGGRYGLIPLAKGKLGESATIILDDTQRPSEAETARRWAREAEKNLEVRSFVTRSFAILTSN